MNFVNNTKRYTLPQPAFLLSVVGLLYLLQTIPIFAQLNNDRYFDDLNVLDQSIYSIYFYPKEQFVFLRPPLIDRNSAVKEPFHSFYPKGYSDSTSFDTATYINTKQFDFQRSEYIDNNGTKYPISPPYSQNLYQYLANRKEIIQTRIRDSLTKTYDVKKAMSRGDLAFLMGQGAGLSIPLPPNPLLNIFGKPELAINVSGQVNLTVGWRWDMQNLGTTSANGQVQSSPIFRQDIRVNVNARVGDKLKFNIDHNTRSMFEYDKKFKIGYEGYDDDIIKKVEIGNITFDIPSTLISSGSELFGIGATFQFGPLFLKTAVSQKQGQKKFMDVNGGQSKQYYSIRAWNYARNHFLIDTAYKKVYNDYFKNSTPLIPKDAAPLRIKQIQVWEASSDLGNAMVAQAVAHADVPGVRRKMGEDYGDEIKKAPIQTGVVERGRFTLLDSNQYVFDYNLGTIVFRNFREDRLYAVSYRIEGPTPDTLDDIYYGYFSNQIGLKDTLVLKLIYRPNLLPSYRSLWARQMKNTYNVGAGNVNTNETTISVWYERKTNDSSDMLEGANDKLVTILGVDQVTNSTGAAPPDGVFDINVAAFFNPERGEITFPNIEPFGSGLETYFEKIGNKDLASSYVYRQIYDTTVDVARKNTARDRFIICGEMSGRASNRIALGAYNMAPGSVRVTLDGVLLREYDDYTVEYATGMLTLRNTRAMMPNSNLKIEYEQRDVFTTSTKTFFGIRADYELYKNRTMTATLGATAVHYSQAKITDRARLGDEPIANTMFGFDLKWTADAPWLTTLLDMLPFYDTKAPSSLNFFGEWAMVAPTPNRINSEIVSDRGAPVAEVDNFEAVTRSTSLGTSFMSWQHSSAPVMPDILGMSTDVAEVEQAQEAQNYRGRMFWWQFSYPRIPMKDPYPNNQAYNSGSQNTISGLYIYFDPSHRGIYNMNPQYLDDINPMYNPADPYYWHQEVRPKLWGGMMRILPTSSANFDNDNVEFLDVMININWGSLDASKTHVYFDIGMISEDIIPNNIGNTEDGITENNPLPNGIIDAGEDIGIDGWDDAREREMYPDPLNLEDDPARDNFRFDFGKDDYQRGPNDYIWFNGFEGNSGSDLGAFPDKEMLNPNNTQTLSTDNAYYTYEMILDPDPNNNPQIVGGNPDAGWFQFRIPIRKPSSKVGDPQFSNMQYVRFRVQGGSFEATIADWKLIGNYWQHSENFEENYNPKDSILSVSYVNVWENSSAPDYYTMPPGVQAPRQASGLDYSVDSRLNEQSLSLSVKNLLWGEERMAVKIFYDMDFFNYKKLKYFVHGDGSMPSSLTSYAGGKPRGYSFVRFGIDSGNYYEYRKPLVEGWQEVEIVLSDLTAVKQIRDTMAISERVVFPVPNDPTAHFAIKGNPILTKIKFVGVGVANPSDAFQELTTTMWIDELRLLDPEASNDWAGVATFSATLADLGTINATFNNYEPNFHMLEERYGNRNQSRDWGIVLTGNLEKFAPKSFNQMKIPISYSHIEKMENPKYVASNDIELAAASNAAYQKVIANGGSAAEANNAANDVKLRSSSLSVQDGWSLAGVKTGIPIKHWLIDQTINKITTNYSYSQIFERSPIYEQRFSWIWRLGLNYNVAIPELLAVKPMKWTKDWFFFGAYSDWKLNFLPSNVTLNLDIQRRRQTEQSRFMQQPSPVVRDFSANRGAAFTWKLSEGGFLNPSFDYKLATISTLVPYELDDIGRQRTGSELANYMFLNNGRLINFGSNNNHTQDITINIKPVLPSVLNFNRFFDLSGTYVANYKWRDPLQSDPTIADAAKDASVNSNLRLKLGIKWKEIGYSIFGGGKTAPLGGGKPRGKTEPTPPPTTSGNGSLGMVGNVFRTIFFDWDNIDFTYNNTNAAVNPGVFGGTGLDNFWGRGMTFRNSQLQRGPSFAYQLGLITNPHGSWNMVSSNKFPYFGFTTTAGLRPPNAVFQDNVNQSNNLDIRTTRALWEGAKLDLNWKMQLTFNKNMTVDTDSNGFCTYSNIISQDNLNRTFLAVPNFFGLNLFGNPMEKVVNIFNQKRAVIDAMGLDSLITNEKTHLALSEAFYEGLEALSITKGAVAKILPAVNWTFRWEGLEKWSIWNNYVKRLNIEHNYTSTYVEIGQTTDLGRTIQTQSMQSGFNPLFGVNASFDEKLLGGVATASIKWSETQNYSVSTASGAIISLQQTTDITANATYIMKDFSIPFMGFDLKNDLEFAFLFTFKKNKTGTFDVLDEKSFTGDNATEGRTLTGNKQIIVEPSAKYSINQLITARFFFRYEGTFNEGAANPGFHNTQVGLDIMLNISGGR
jgi:cell surface protein SprA